MAPWGAGNGGPGFFGMPLTYQESVSFTQNGGIFVMGPKNGTRLYTRKVADRLEKELRAEIAALRDELKATAAKLHERLARLPIVKEFPPETVYYAGRTLRDRVIDFSVTT
jgi:hypothetical protein